jgi:Reverse transcriptase (RNA-dependent DNA polymerase)
LIDTDHPVLPEIDRFWEVKPHQLVNSFYAVVHMQKDRVCAPSPQISISSFPASLHAWRKAPGRGCVIAIRYADDSVVGFEKKATAQLFLEQLRERLAKFGLSLHPDKTRLIEFGRFAAERRRTRGDGRPETFDFLGFTHCCVRIPAEVDQHSWLKPITIPV